MRNEHLGVLIKKANLEFDRQANHFLSSKHITTSQFRIIKHLILQPEGSLKQIDIENFFGMTNPSVTGILQNLEKKGLIYRKNHLDDKRCKVILLTDKAKKLKDQILQISESIEDNFTQSMTKEETQLLKELLTKLITESKKKL
ncbi:MarR family winged helix-turn-helix transcriptional regulator [Streptococcus didelphis]|uniref:MarR family winged helix-turn-helix transcriptional regulator n=1 Tax=Streptococcus didelphis TaxID=102886 RepID=UPI00037B7577|nr:MarR family transcriptional regulator [Streptococcus didelphis]